MNKLLAIIFAALMLTPGAAALTIPVNAPIKESGQYYSQVFPGQNALDMTFSFNPATYNVTANPWDNASTIYQSDIIVTYAVSNSGDTQGGFFTGIGNFFQKVVGLDSAGTREYDTHLQINATDWLNISTFYTRSTGLLGGFVWKVCDSVSYTNGTFFSGAGSFDSTTSSGCNQDLFRGPPTKIVHEVQWGNIPCKITCTANDTNSTHYGFIVTTKNNNNNVITPFGRATDFDMQIPGGTFANQTRSVSLSTRNIANDAATTTVEYLFIPQNQFTTITGLATSSQTQNCNSFALKVVETLTLGFIPCDNPVGGVLNKVFSGVNYLLSFVFGFFPGGDKFADFMTKLVSIVVGMPIFAVGLFIAAPAKTFVFFTWYFTLLGILHYASSANAQANVIWETPLKIWFWTFKGIFMFAKWLYELVVAGISAIASAL